MEIRKFQKSDTEQVTKLLHDSVKILNLQESSEKQAQSAGANLSFHDWEESFQENFTIVAEINNTIVGIAQLEENGHINCFYCHPDYRRRGIGGQLYAALEDYAYSKNIQTLHSEANTTDISFFTKMGFKTVQKQKTQIGGEVVSTFIIKKIIYSGK